MLLGGEHEARRQPIGVVPHDLLAESQDVRHPIVDQPITREAPFDFTDDVAAPAQAAEVARYPTLGQVDFDDELAHRPWALAEQLEDADSGRIGKALEERDDDLVGRQAR